MTFIAPRVSVVMPVYNVSAYVGMAVRSVLEQSFEDFELIIVDDGGTDDSVAICRSFSDRRIRIVSQRNRGLAGARNTGIAIARGAYIALIDSDDIWTREKLAVHVAHLDANPDVGASYGGAELIDEQNRLLQIRQRPKLGPVSAKDVFCGRAISNGSTPVFRVEMLAQAARPADAEGRVQYFDETLRRSEDVECWTRLALRSTLRFEALDGAWTCYRVNAAGLSADVLRQLQSWDDVAGRLALIDPDFIAQHRTEARARELRYLARRCVVMRDRGLCMAMAKEAFTSCPSLLWREPVKSLTTLAACFALRLMPLGGFSAVLRLAKPGLAEV